ncbi:acyl-CoA dehydrogenase (plasmid) [Rhodococcus sp. USK10]|uniref:acyl-CoA dehydrogenase family protein n=1 Tax=Rhodococcus sp. USK10 TaxID=2789739 RepID=UPI001C5F10B5|nr:acyl-CoA dehydrogenase [Rhodococcus sp. USK10]QYB00333.1 acyl-CoA dehydrogenase [Rhodococcus sp. USK10]
MTSVNYSAPATMFQLPSELQELRDHTRNVVEKECFPLEAKFLSNQWASPDTEFLGWGEGQVDGSLPAEDWKRLREVSEQAGLYAIGLPEELGGGGLGILGDFVVACETQRSVVPLPRAHVPLPLLKGTDAQKEQFLAPALEDKVLMAFAQSEPNAGSDPAAMTTTARKTDDGWRIDGTKMWISGAQQATHLLVLAVTDANKRARGGITAFIVDAQAEGVSTAPIETWLTRHGHQYTVYLDGVHVPDDRVLGEVGGGFGVGQEFLQIQDRLARASLAAGILSRGLDLAIDWAKNRITFGKPIAERQAIQWMLVDAFLDLKSIRAMGYETAARADTGEDVRYLASASKFMGGNYGHRSIDKLMQVLGGMGETREQPFTTWYRQLRHGRIGGGTDEIQRMLIARALLEDGSTIWHA